MVMACLTTEEMIAKATAHRWGQPRWIEQVFDAIEKNEVSFEVFAKAFIPQHWRSPSRPAGHWLGTGWALAGERLEITAPAAILDVAPLQLSINLAMQQLLPPFISVTNYLSRLLCLLS